MGTSQTKVPVALATGLVCLLAGAGGGVATMIGMGYRRTAEGEAPAPPPPGGMQGGPPGGMMMGRPGGQAGMMGMGGGMMGMMGGPGGGMMGGPGGSMMPKAQLANLVTKLDALTTKPLTLSLTADQKKKIREELSGLEDKEDLAPDEAMKRIAAVLAVLKDQEDVLAAAGFSLPGKDGPHRPPVLVKNPFTEEDEAKHLKALRERLGK